MSSSTSHKSFISFLRYMANEKSDTLLGSAMNEVLNHQDMPKSRVTYSKVRALMSELGYDKPVMDALYKGWVRFAKTKGIEYRQRTS